MSTSFYVGRMKVLIDRKAAFRMVGIEWNPRWKQLTLCFWFKNVTFWWRGR